MNNAIYLDELYHHGILGQKWGVRRYQNYDGSYTRAGLKRYNDSLNSYNKSNNRYKNAKNNYKITKKNNQSTYEMKTEIVNARMRKKLAKRQLDKDYKHLKQDKLGDQGKELYSKGKTIRKNDATIKFLASLGSISAASLAYNYNTGAINRLLRNIGVDISNTTVNTILGAVSIGTESAAAASKVKNNYQNKRLRAYYSHTSKY